MAKGILRFFGALAIIAGAMTIVFGLMAGGPYALVVVVPVGAGFLISGAPLLGFAQVIELLEEIARNTRSAPAHVASRGDAPTLALPGFAPPALGVDLSLAGGGAPPRVGDHSMSKVVVRSNYRGLDYRTHEDGMITARLADGPYTWENNSAFKKWMDARPAV